MYLHVIHVFFFLKYSKHSIRHILTVQCFFFYHVIHPPTPTHTRDSLYAACGDYVTVFNPVSFYGTPFSDVYSS